MTLTQVTTGGVDENINIDSNTLKVDGTNNRVGVGTPSPSSILHLVGTDTAYSGNVAVGPIATLADTAGRTVQIVAPGSVGEGGIGTSTNHDFTFFTGNSEKVRLKQNGNLGLGTNSPDNMLHLNGASPSIRFSDTDANGSAFSIVEDNAGLLKLRNDAGNSGTGSGIAFDVDGSEKVRLDSAGRMGIGTQGPQLQLHVRDGALASAPTPNSNCDVVIEGTTNTGIQFLSGGQAQIRFGDAASTGAGSVIYNHSDNLFKLNYNNSGALTFNNGSGEVGRFDGSGRLLVGATSSSADVSAVFRGSSSSNVSQIHLANTAATASLTSGNTLGVITFASSDGHKYADILGDVDGAPGTNDFPGRIVFRTCPNSSASVREHMRLSSGGLLTGNAIAIERVFALLYSRLSSHSGCNSGGPSGTFTNFDDSEPAFKTVQRTVTSAPTNYRFIGTDSGSAFTFFVGCSDQVSFSISNKDADASTYRSWVCCHEDFLNALAGLPSNSTRTSLP